MAGWLLALLALSVAACGQPNRPAPSAPATAPAARVGDPAPTVPRGPASAAAGPVTLALLVPQSARAEGAAQLAGALANAAEMAVQDLRIRDLSLRVYDTGGEPARAEAAARRAIADGADILLGPLFAQTTQAVARVAIPARRRVISFSTDASVAGDPVYVSGYVPEAEARRILEYAATQGRRFVALFRPRTAYGDAAARGVGAAEARGAVRLVATAAYERSFKGIEAASGPFAEEARGLGAEALLLPSGGQELQAVASFMNFHRLDPLEVRYLGLGQWNSAASFDEPSLLGGWFPAPDPDAFGVFAGRYRARYGGEPPVLATLGHTAVQVAGQLVREARAGGGTGPVFSSAALTRPEGFAGALGPVRFRPDGTAEHAMAILEVGPRRFLMRDPAPSVFRAGS